MSHDYDDIIDMPRPKLRNHTPMPMTNRAAQFAPFAALSGHNDAIIETARWTDTPYELDDSANAELNRKLGYLLEHIDERRAVTITFFQPDTRKAGGYYVPVTGVIKKLDEYEQCLVMEDKLTIPIAAITEIKLT
jgi:hypothetical protein